MVVASDRPRLYQNAVSVSIFRLRYDVLGLAINELITECDPHRFKVVLVQFKYALQSIHS